MMYQLLRKLTPVIVLVILGIFAIRFAGSVIPTDTISVVNTPTTLAVQPIPSEPINVRISASLVAMTPQQLAKSADIVIQGVARGPAHSQWNTPKGFRQPNVEIGSNNLIYTDTPVEVNRYLKGAQSSKVLTVRTLGGQVGADRVRFSEEAELQPGQPVVLFLTQNDVMTGKYGPVHYMVAGAGQGKYVIEGTQAKTPSDERSLAALTALIAASQH
ncbi:MAG: hypothetical protein H0X37_21245 [Herpetosiphonaceae bacterium]|nr:hypothetical protein [Herpetosiphonaceae bacterium]